MLLTKAFPRMELYCALASVNAVHAWAFFHMLEKVGAVSSAVMKGTQLVLVFALSVVFFCRYQATQCFSWAKGAGAACCVVGLLVYAISTTPTTSNKRPPMLLVGPVVKFASASPRPTMERLVRSHARNVLSLAR